MMKILMSFLVGLVLVGCGNDGLNLEDSTLGTGREEAVTVGFGESCQTIGNEKIHCNEGLTCQLDTEDPSLGGVCVQPKIKNVECSKVQDPVCGLKGNNKNGYLNPCQADRHGALVLYKGFCYANQEVERNCNARVNSLGNCAELFEGFEFNPKSKACGAVKVAGCDAEIPFETLEDCQNVCE